MKYEDVLQDINKLVGLNLRSIRPGANITILEVDSDRGNIVLETESGKTRSRPLDEIKRIWDQLMLQPAVHVDGVLHGSGSSRNQPETILANLPYIEWLKVNNKKHIAFVGKDTHTYGTLKQMDAFSAIAIAEHLAKNEVAEIKNIIATSDVIQSLDQLKRLCRGTVKTIDKGLYALNLGAESIIVLQAESYGLIPGTYCVITANVDVLGLPTVNIHNKRYYVLNQGDTKVLIMVSQENL